MDKLEEIYINIKKQLLFLEKQKANKEALENYYNFVQYHLINCDYCKYKYYKDLNTRSEKCNNCQCWRNWSPTLVWFDIIKHKLK